MNIASTVFWLKNRLFRKEAQTAYNNAIKYCSDTRNAKEENSFNKRRELVSYAYHHCAFYHKLYETHGFHPSQLKEESDWGLVPIVEKKMIRENAISFLSDQHCISELGSITTGGSTGKPLQLYKSKHVHYEVLGWRALGWWGISPSDNEAIMHRRVPTTSIQKLKNRMMWWPTKRTYLSATAVSDEDIARFLAEVKRNRIKWIVGYCATIEHVADYILHNKIRIEGIKLIWSTSSPLTKVVRGKIEQAFNCRVMDQYGCCEMGNIAIQKPGENCLTINSDYVHVDIVNENDKIITNTKQYGDVLITDLNTFEFPLIKYRLGDKSRLVMTMEESDDGFPKLDFVQGRISDAIWLPDGTYVDGAYLTTICDNYSQYIACYQIHQQLDNSIDISFIPKNDTYDVASIIFIIIKDLEELTKHQIEIRNHIVSEIPDFAGKRKFIISEISLEKSRI